MKVDWPLTHKIEKKTQKNPTQKNYKSLTWKPHCKSFRGCPRATCKHELEGELKKTGWTCKLLERMAKEKATGNLLVDGLCFAEN